MATGIRSNGFTAYPKNPLYSGGKANRSTHFAKTITSGNSAIGNLYILAGALTLDDKILFVKGSTPAFTSMNDNDLGFFKKNEDGTFTALRTSADASAVDLLWNGADLSSALTYRELLGTLNTSLDRTKTIGQLLGYGSDQEPVGGVYLGLTTNVASTAATALLDLEIVIEQATCN